MTDSYDEASALYPGLKRYKKLIVSLVGTTAPLVVFLVGPAQPTAAVVGAILGWVAVNVGVERAENE